MTTPENFRRRQRLESLLIVALCVGLVGAWLYFRGRTDQTAQALQAQADASSSRGACTSAWAAELTDALQDRDAVNSTARAAQREVWTEIDRYVQGASTDREALVLAIKRFRAILRRLDRTASINPYPEITPCFAATDAPGTLALMAYIGTHPCWGRAITLWGTRGEDTLIGTDKDDVIFAGRGNDLISAGHGHDYICAGRGDDTVNGGPGRDSVRGGLGDDLCVQTEEELSC